AREVRKLRGRHHRLGNASLVKANTCLQRSAIASELLDIAVEFEPAGTTDNFGLKLRTGDSESLIIGCDLAHGHAYLDRIHASRGDFHPKFTGIHDAPLRLRDGRVPLRAIVNASSVEVFLILLHDQDETNKSENVGGNAPHPSYGHPLPIGWGEGHSS